MGIREKINQNPLIASGAVAVFALVVIVGSILRSGGSHGPVGEGSNLVFFSDDDGKTWFKDDVNKIAPFDHNGKPAARVYVFKCPDKEFVGYLERYTAQGLKVMQDAKTANSPKKKSVDRVIEANSFSNVEVKKPGDAKWITPQRGSFPAELLNPKCADGKAATPVEP